LDGILETLTTHFLAPEFQLIFQRDAAPGFTEVDAVS